MSKIKWAAWLSIFLSLGWFMLGRWHEPVTQTTVRSIQPIASVTECEPQTYNGHPVDCDGFVTDGSPQMNDTKCVGTDDQKAACYIARRPECLNGSIKTVQFAMYCWAPIINLYPWSHVYMFNVMYCESKGKEDASNGSHFGLLQETDGSSGAYNPATNIKRAYYDYWVTGGYGQWQCKG